MGKINKEKVLEEKGELKQYILDNMDVLKHEVKINQNRK